MKEILLFLQSLRMERPLPYGLFHFMWLALSVGFVILFFSRKGKIKEKPVLLIYGFGSLILELLKQFMWGFSVEGDRMVLDYSWYSFPFQLCSTPMYVAIILGFIKEGKVKKALINYLSYFTVISAFMVMLLPDSCFCRDLVVNVHTMYLHCGSFVVSAFLIINRKEETDVKGFLRGFTVFLIMVVLAMSMNELAHVFGITENNTFNMFYISPYFTSSLPVFSIIQPVTSYPVFLLTYVVAIAGTAYGINRVINASLLHKEAVRKLAKSQMVMPKVVTYQKKRRTAV